jgi:voltage-gated potassium channel
MTNNLKTALIIIAALIAVGSVGFHVIEGWGLLESIYVTVMTLTTVGYGDFAPQSRTGMVFTMALVAVGVGTMLYTVGLVAQTMVEGRLMNLMGRGKMEKAIEKMSNHYIICGCGRIGMLITRELAAEKVPFVVVDNRPGVIERLQEEGVVFLQGDATHDKSLIDAGIKRAKGIVCVLPTDAQNLYVILTAKELNPDIWVLARSEEEQSERRLLRAGADRVISPYTLGGNRMAMAILRPAMLDFIEITTRRQSLELRMDELPICEGSPIIGKSLEESEIRQRYGLIIVAVKKDSGKMIFNPMASYLIESGDKLIALGEEDNVTKLSQACLG